MQESSTKALYSVGENETCLTAVLDNNKRRPKLALFTRPKNFEWVSVTSEEFIAEVMAVAKGLIANGVEHGDRVALLSETRYEWTVMDFAIWAAGAVTVPIYGSSSASQIQWIIEDSGTVFAITETREHTELMRFLELDSDGKPRLKGSPTKLRRILEFNSSALDTLAFEGRDVSDDAVWERIHSTKSSDLASLVYTSGTTGRPKGCRLTHANWLAEARSLLTHNIGRTIARPGMRYITFLPLAHVFARAISLAMAIGGAQQSHWSDFSTISIEFQRVQPNMILGVPRVFEKVRNGVQALGGAVQFGISGGSAMNPELLHFFRGIGTTVYEGYGLTESTAAFCVNYDDNIIGTVGRPSGGCSAHISEGGELCLKGPVVFDGYWNNEEATEECFDEDGYFHTGDLGEILDSGHIKITGRKKELLVTAGGKNVSPGPLEDRMRTHPLISQVMLVGDGQPFIGCLVTLDEVAVEKWKSDHGINDNVSNRELHANPVLRAEIQDAINDANSTVSHAEAVKKFHILDRDFTEEEGELTATLKVKRHVVMQHFARDVANLYQK